MIGRLRVAALGAALSSLCACKGEAARRREEEPAAAPAAVQPSAAAGEPADRKGAARSTAQVMAKAPPPRLYDKPVERRLYSDRIEASSFLWTAWNKFQENYHPNYLMDGDPATAWVEGADSSGAGEWIRIRLSPVESVSRIRLRVQNGYQKSRSLYQKNARARQLTVTALPGGRSHGAILPDEMGWQEIAFDVPSGRLEALELKVGDVYEGSRYTDHCISEVEVHVTGLTVENPAFEKAKLDDLLAWKKNRLAAAALFGSGSAKAAALPILPGYRVVAGEATAAAAGDTKVPFGGALDAVAVAAPSAAPPVARARAAIGADFAGWLPVEVVARQPLALPAVDGLYEPGSQELVFEPRDDAFMMPSSPQGVLLSSRNLSLFDAKERKDPRKRTECKEGKTWFMRPPRATAGGESAAGAGDSATGPRGPLPGELLLVRCVVAEEREGESTYTVWQLLEFDEQGNLALMVGPQDTQWFEWKPQEQAAAGAILAGGVRVRNPGDPVQKLVDARVVARD